MSAVRHFLCILLICCISYAYTQKPSPNKRAQAAYVEAGKALRLNKLNEANAQLLIAITHDPNFATAHQQLGDIFRKQQRYEKAITHYQRVLEIDPSLTSLTYFALGESLLFTGNYQEAIQTLTAYRQQTTLSDNSQKLTDKYLADCRYALQHRLGEKTILHRLAGTINTVADEYFPKLTADNQTIIFTRKTDNQENFYESMLGQTGWTEAQMLVGAINSKDFNEGAHCISPDGKYLFFTGCNWPNGLGSCDIYVSKRENGSWSTPRNLGAPINGKGWEAQPAISADGKTLYFVSNRPGGIGGYDIYRTTLQENGQWSIPQNLGAQINTAFDEAAPYIHADGKTLYFASNGWPGFGQKDIFTSQLDSNQQWSTPVNLGSGINNFRDQTSIHVSMNGQTGHLSSQDSVGNLDIYSFQLNETQRPAPVAYVAGTILDAADARPLGARIDVLNTHTGEIVFQDQSDPTDGSFLATLPIGHNYAFQIQRQGYLFTSTQYALNDPQFTEERFETAIRLKAIAKGAVSTLNNIYFAVNKYDVLPESAADLNLLAHFLQLNPKLHIEIAGHTDNTGNPQKNLLLSAQRAAAVKEYLLKQGIAPHRIATRGYGATAPLASNETEQGRRLNRRTDFTITQL